MAESIKVVCRFRGNEKDLQQEASSQWIFSPNEKSLSVPPCWNTMKATTQSGVEKESQGGTNFTFDHVLDAKATQEKMYRVCAQETVHQFMKGFNGTIFAYGQSGSGKTFTMLGPDEVVDVIKRGVSEKNSIVPIEIQALYGIIPRAIYEIFMEINKEIETRNSQFEIKVNYFEIYQESLNNLLAANPSQMQGLKLREQKNGSIVVLNCDPIFVTSPEDLFELLMIGQRARSVASTNQNERSSRSHTILVLEYVQKNPDGSMKQAKLNLVDLAGSERIAKTGATGKTLEEAKKINLSLTTLGQCIKNLTEGKTHVPFRDSKLTFFLKESLGGNSKTTLVCTASQKLLHLEESVQTLKFAQRAKRIKNKAVSNVMRSPKEMEELIQKLKSEVLQLKKQLRDHGLNPEVNAGLKPAAEEEEVSLEVPPIQQEKAVAGGGSGVAEENEDMSTIFASQSVIEEDENNKETREILRDLQNEWSEQRRHSNKELQQMGEDLNLRITELQTEYDHYKEYAETRIMELEDQVERLKSQDEGADDLQRKIQGLNFIVQDRDDELKRLKKIIEKEKTQYQQQIQHLENQVQAKDIFIKELEKDNDTLREKVEKAGFEIFCKIKEEISNVHLAAEEMNKEHSGTILEKISREVEEMLGFYSHQEETIQRLKERNQKLKVRLNQMQFFQQQHQNNSSKQAKNNGQNEDVQILSSYSHTEIMSVHSMADEDMPNEVEEALGQDPHPPIQALRPPRKQSEPESTHSKKLRKQQAEEQMKKAQQQQQQQEEEEKEERDSIKAIREKLKKKQHLRSNSMAKQEPSNKLGSAFELKEQKKKAEASQSNRHSLKEEAQSNFSHSTFRRNGSTFWSKTTIGYQNDTQSQLLKLTLDNIKLVQTNAKLLTLLKQDINNNNYQEKTEELLEQVSSLEATLKEKQFQILYLEKLALAAENKTADEENKVRGGKIQKLEQELVSLKLEHQKTKNKNIDLEEEVRHLKKVNEDIKREKNLYKLDSAKVIRNSVNQIMQQNQYKGSRFRGGILGHTSSGKEVITHKVEFNEGILSGKIFDEVKPNKRFNKRGGDSKRISREPSEYMRNFGGAAGGKSGKNKSTLLKQSITMANRSMLAIDVNASTLVAQEGSGGHHHFSGMSGHNSPTGAARSKGRGSNLALIGQLVRNPPSDMYSQIMQEMPINDGVVKQLHGQHERQLELEKMLLNDSEDSADEDKNKE